MSLVHRWKGLSRAMRWSVLGLGVIAVYFGVVEPVLDLKARFDARASSAAARLAAYEREASERREAVSMVERGMSRFTPVAWPGDAGTRTEEFNRKVNEILDAHQIRERTQRTRNAPLGPGPLDRTIGRNERIDRRIMDIQFEASPEQVAAALADLEQCPEVASVSKVQLDRAASGRRLRASLTVEAWVRAPKEQGR